MPNARRDVLRMEFQRKAFHLLCLLFLGAYLLIGMPLVLYIQAGWVALITLVETLRLRHAPSRRLVEMVFAPIIRGKEAHSYTGAFYTSWGVLACFYFFGGSPIIVKTAFLFLAFGDSASALAGRVWGRRRFTLRGETRSLEGSLAGVCAVSVCAFLLGLPLGPAAAAVAAFLLADAVPLPPDDNFWIPVLTGAALRLCGL